MVKSTYKIPKIQYLPYYFTPKNIYLFCEHTCKETLKDLSHQSGVIAAFTQRYNKLCRRQQRCGNAVKTLCNRLEGNAAAFCFEQGDMAFAQPVRQRAVGTLWQRCKVF